MWIEHSIGLRLIIPQKVRAWFGNKRRLMQEKGKLPTTVLPKPSKDVSPYFQKLRSRAPAPSKLWAKENKAKIDDALERGDIGDRQHVIAQLFAGLPEEERKYWDMKVEDVSAEQRNDPDAPFQCISNYDTTDNHR